MTTPPDEVKFLFPAGFRDRLSRRAVLQLGATAAGAAFLAACGSDTKASTATTAGTSAPKDTATAATSAGTVADTAAPSTVGATVAATGDTTAPAAAGDYSTIINKSSGTLNMFTWGDYNDPGIVGKQAEDALGVTLTVDYYASNEDLITKLSASGGKSGFDVVVPTGPYIPQMIEKGLLQKFDKSKLPNIVNVDPLYLGQAWDTSNDYSVCKDWGSTGWIYDKTVVTTSPKTWADFIKVCQTEASGNCSVLDSAPNVIGMYAWANGLDWNTEDKGELDAAEKFLVDDFAKHIKAFDSYPSTKIAEGAYALSMVWNGDARQAYTRIADAGGKPENWVWTLGGPQTELWMDNYCIASNSPNADAAHAWINWLLVPEISVQDVAYHGYNSGMRDIGGLIKQYQPKLEKADMIFFSDEQVKTMRIGKVNSSQNRQVEIVNNMKAKAGG